MPEGFAAPDWLTADLVALGIPLVAFWLCMGARLARDHRHAEHDVGSQRPAAVVEGQHVGRVVAAAELAVEAPAFAGAVAAQLDEGDPKASPNEPLRDVAIAPDVLGQAMHQKDVARVLFAPAAEVNARIVGGSGLKGLQGGSWVGAPAGRCEAYSGTHSSGIGRGSAGGGGASAAGAPACAACSPEREHIQGGLGGGHAGGKGQGQGQAGSD
jgi:hypothetical protein